MENRWIVMWFLPDKNDSCNEIDYSLLLLHQKAIELNQCWKDVEVYHLFQSMQLSTVPFIPTEVHGYFVQFWLYVTCMRWWKNTAFYGRLWPLGGDNIASGSGSSLPSDFTMSLQQLSQSGFRSCFDVASAKMLERTP
jgi:hypothetical protein